MTASKTVMCVGAVVMRGDTVLLVRQSKGHSLEGQWTIPWGLLDPGESPARAALRETEEEAQIRATMEGLLGVQELPEPWQGWIGLVYMCRHVSGEPKPDGSETDAAGFFSASELNSLNEPVEKLTDWLVRRVLSGQFTLTREDSDNPFGPSGGFL
jgi:ADP-ribose pyrophosphatase YjhB (NUDIX family)